MIATSRKAPAALQRARQFTEEALTEGAFPGAQVLVAREGEVLWHETFGHAVLEPAAERMNETTLIDTASLTKALVTATAAAQLVGAGAVSLESRLGDMYPPARGTDKEGLTLRDLLAHQAGFPLYVPYWREIIVRYSDFHALPWTALRQEIVGRILHEPLASRPGEKQQYSDFDFILLGEALAHVAGMPLDAWFAEQIAAPLGIAARFVRLPADDEPPVPGRFAATERCPWRGEVLCGAVHDDHAYLMGGVGGHAGLFASAADVYAITEAWRRAWHGAEGILKPQAARMFWTKPVEAPGFTWTLGWDTPTPGESTSGSHFSARSVGHLGFTGSSIWIDLERDITVILLTNRIHPLRSNLGIKAFRPAFHDRVMQGLLDAG